MLKFLLGLFLGAIISLFLLRRKKSQDFSGATRLSFFDSCIFAKQNAHMAKPLSLYACILAGAKSEKEDYEICPKKDITG